MIKNQIKFNLILPHQEVGLRDIIDHFDNEKTYHRMGKWYVIDEISAPFDHEPEQWKITIKMTEVKNAKSNNDVE